MPRKTYAVRKEAWMTNRRLLRVWSAQSFGQPPGLRPLLHVAEDLQRRRFVDRVCTSGVT